MLTFEKVLGIFADYLDADETTEVYISRHGCVRVEFGQDFHYCTGEVCHTPKELFDLLADDYRTYVAVSYTHLIWRFWQRTRTRRTVLLVWKSAAIC